MTETMPKPLERPRALRLSWAFQILIHPKQTFQEIASLSGSIWFTPLLILSISALLVVLVAGPIKQQAAQAGQFELPPEYQYLSPEDQARIQEALSATQGPVFIYVFPALSAIVGVWMGWLVVGGLLHLTLTLLGGRGATSAAMNLVAWSAMPFVVRDLVHILYMLSNDRLISNPGLSGFVQVTQSSVSLFLNKFLSHVDLYLIWHIVLLMIGVQVASGLIRKKSILGAAVPILLVLTLQTLLSFLITRLAGLTVIRPFFF
jgi:hypothetical protein